MQKPMKADELEVEPDLHLDCDVLILEYTIHNAVKLVLDSPATGQKDRDEALIDLGLHLRMVESFLKIFQTSHPDHSLSSTTKFLLHLLQFASLLLLRHDDTAVSLSETSLSRLRQANQTRASDWRHLVRENALKTTLLDAYSSSIRHFPEQGEVHNVTSRDISPSKAQALWSPRSSRLLLKVAREEKGVKTWSEIAATSFPNRSIDAVKRHYSTLMSRQAEGGTLVSDTGDMDVDMDIESLDGANMADMPPNEGPVQDNDDKQNSVTLLDLIPSFIDLTAKRMTMGDNMNGRASNNSSNPPTPECDDPSSETASGQLAWATEPQWLRLAAAFMLQAVLEAHLDHDLLRPPGASFILEAFAWGWTPSFSSKAVSENRTSSTPHDNRIRIDRSVTIPDSDEGDITILTSTPIAIPPSHPALFVLKHEENTSSAGVSWRALRLQALDLLIPSPGDDVHAHLVKLREHHPYNVWEQQLLDFLQHLFTSIEQPLLVQLERVYPAWAAAHPDDVAMSQGTQLTMTQQMMESPVKAKMMRAQSQRQTQGTPTKKRKWESTMVAGEGSGSEDDEDDICDAGWLAVSGESVRVEGMTLPEEEVDVLMKLVATWWT